jgi:hypothetical protein
MAAGKAPRRQTFSLAVAWQDITDFISCRPQAPSPSDQFGEASTSPHPCSPVLLIGAIGLFLILCCLLCFAAPAAVMAARTSAASVHHDGSVLTHAAALAVPTGTVAADSIGARRLDDQACEAVAVAASSGGRHCALLSVECPPAGVVRMQLKLSSLGSVPRKSRSSAGCAVFFITRPRV